MSVFLQPIYTQTVGAGGAASLTFNNIPQTFTDLKIVISARVSGSGAAYIGALPNGNASSIYSYTYVGISPVAGTVYTGHNLNFPYGFFVFGANPNMTANSFTDMEIYIPNYSGGALKQGIVDDGSEDNTVGGAAIAATAILMNSTAPITSLVVKDTITGGTLVEGSQVTIYGVANNYDVVAPTAPTIGTVTDQAGFASVAFTPAANDSADLYQVTTTPSSTTSYGNLSPIVAPATLGTSYTYQVAAVNPKGTSASSASSAVTSANSFASIATITSDGTLGSAVFTNIPQNYTHLQVRIFARSARAAANDSIYFRANGDFGTNYSWHTMYGDGSGVYSGNSINDNNMQPLYIPAASATSGIFGCAVLDILDYTNTSKYKVFKSLNGYDSNGSGLVCLQSSLWRNQTPISSLLFANYFTSASFAAGTVFALYGIA